MARRARRSAARFACCALAASAAALAAAPAASAQEAPSYPSAVVLVSGYNSSTAFTSPDPACAGKEGDTWSNPDGPAAALRGAGHAVFTAPVKHGTDPQLPPCTSAGAPVPPGSTFVDSYGDIDANGAALAGFLAFLRAEYGVERVELVAHSMGGLWSRGALTQDGAYAGLAIRSLTTLGTPYTGSFAADLAVELNGGRCDFSSVVEQDICQALLGLLKTVFADSGPTTIKQLTHGFLETWNPDQRIGSCPVTTVSGTFLAIPLVPFTYYSPSDGLVGEASALARTAYDINLDPIPAPDIPGLRSGGTFPVVHSPALSFLSSRNLLNQAAISDVVVDAVGGVDPNGPLCTAPAAQARRGLAADARRVRVPLRAIEAPNRRGRLADPGAEDAVIARAGARLRCGESEVPLSPLLGDERLHAAFPVRCDGPLRAKGGGRGAPEALMLRSLSNNDVVVVQREDRLRIRVRGRGLHSRDARVRAVVDGDGAALELDAKGNAEPPGGERHVVLKVRVPLGKGEVAHATAVLSP